ncbi:uncharacterized protein KGF55_000332 [Candida pseudojiufengensis]|uniref:uncharacterized protein n=1 Tax=Candida pseudojiufengensis TaxID=497109 RepID=UPI00222538CB|nr:uncharacterized protein KGF55_000332 [Candida pseudojiufengensis]KAI5966923.1 hypothetical protein KGF55_000332 [Candida pseudojiufengensis]
MPSEVKSLNLNNITLLRENNKPKEESSSPKSLMIKDGSRDICFINLSSSHVKITPDNISINVEFNSKK